MDSTARTAIHRKKPSSPMVWLSEHGMLRGRMLDYGCGHGFDAEHFKMEAYDPHLGPGLPYGTFDTITCVYVLNVLPPKRRKEVVDKVKSLLRQDGRAYFVVRRDKLTTKGQYKVFVNLPVAYSRGGAFDIYVYHKRGAS